MRRRARPAQRAAATPPTDWRALSAAAQSTLATLRAQPASAYAAALRDHVRRHPTNPFLWHALAKHLLRSPAAAAAVLQEAIACVPPGRRGGLFDALGNLELRRGDPERAVAVFADGLRADPYAALFVSLGVAHARADRVAEARATFRAGSLAFPAHAALWRAWAHMESRCGSPREARDLWREAVRRDAGSARAWARRVEYEERCGATGAEMVEMLYGAVAACPRDCALRMRLAKLEEKRRGISVARGILIPVESQNDDHVLRALARMEMELGNAEKARACYRKAADAETERLHASKGSWRRREEGRGKGKGKGPGRGGGMETTVKSLHAWALMEVRLGSNEAARKILDKALTITQNDSAIWRAIAELEASERNFEQARKAFQNAIAIDPEDMRLFLAWGKAEAMAGDLSRAGLLMDRVTRAGSSLTPSSGEDASTDEAHGSLSDQQHALDTELGSPTTFREDRNPALTPSILAEALRERAMLASRNGHFDDSVDLLTRASQLEPHSAAGWRLLASQELRLHGIESARKVFETGIQRIDQSAKPKLLHWWGQDERANAHIDKARELFRKATCANPFYMSAWLSWGLMEKSEGSVDEACDIFEQASERAERDVVRAPYLFQAWGRVEELERGRPEYAAEVFRRGVNLAPKSGALWTAWGLLEERRGNIERARELFKNATEFEPKHGSAWHSWALLESRRCNYERAGELFRCGNKHEPTNSSLLASWALMEGKDLSNIAGSRHLFERAVTADPQYSPAWHSWGTLEMKSGALEKARQLFRRASEIRPDDPSPWHSLGVLEAEYGKDVEKAVAHWKRAIEISPANALSYQSWALLAARRLSDLPEARRLFSEGIQHCQHKPSDVALLLQSWASLENQEGNSEEARKLLRRSLDVDRRRAETWQSLALVEKSRGNREGARRLLGDAVECVSPACTAGPLYVIWATLEAEQGEVDEARRLFAMAIRSNPSHGPTWRAYAAVESKYGDEGRAAEIRLTEGAMFGRNANANEEFLDLV